MIPTIEALQSLRPKAEWVLRGEELEWHDTVQTQPSDAEIQAEITRLQTEYDNNLFQRQRATDYPSLQDQADMQYWDSVNGTTTWLDAINEIKTRYPKP
jgi:hypothetical protein